MSGAYNQVRECPQCGNKKGVTKRRANTAYCNDADNFIVSCQQCFEEYCNYFEERWKDYWDEIRAGLY